MTEKENTKVIGWKVVNSDGTSLNVEPGRYQLKYAVGEMTEALLGTVGVFYFTDIHFAKSLYKSLSRIRDVIIIEIEVLMPKEKPKTVAMHADTEALQGFYDTVKRQDEWPTTENCDTLCVNTSTHDGCAQIVKVIREV